MIQEFANIMLDNIRECSTDMIRHCLAKVIALCSKQVSMMNKQILFIFLTCTVCLPFGTPASLNFWLCLEMLGCQSMFKRALNDEPQLKAELSGKDVRTFPLGPPFFLNESLWDLYCQVREQVDNCSTTCGSQWFAPGHYLCEKVEAVKKHTKCYDKNHFGQYYHSQSEAELRDPIYTMCTRYTHNNQGTLDTFSPGTIMTKANVIHEFFLRNECLYLSCYLNTSEAKARPDCVQSIMLVRSMVHQYLWTIYKVLQRSYARDHFPEECRRLVNISINDFRMLLPTRFYIFNHVRQWGNNYENISLVLLFPHPTFNNEYNLLKPYIIKYLKDNGIPAVPDLAYNVTCSVSPCTSSICNYTHQCLGNYVKYCRMKIYVEQDMINRNWTCQIALVLTATNVILDNLTESPNYIRKPRSLTTPNPVPQILIKGIFVVDGQDRVTVMKMETFTKTIQHFGDSLIYNGYGQPDIQTNVDFLNHFKAYCKDTFSGIYYGVNHEGNSIGILSQYHILANCFTQIHPIYMATKIGSIICLPTESSILWSENNGTHWHIKKARNQFWINAIRAGVPMICILLIAILGLNIAYRIQSHIIFHGIKRITGSSIWVIEKIGSGWSEKSQVYRVVVTLANGMNKKMAMKAVANKQKSTQMLFARFRLAREAAFLTNNKLTNINILKGFGVCLQGDATFPKGQNYGKEVLLMELCDGSLQNYLEGKREEQSMNLQKLVAIMIDIANGLNHMHKHSIIHNDLSVDNILYVTVSNTRPDGLTIICKIADFELSKEVSKIYKASEDTPFPVAHSAPEVLMRKELSKASDVWMMGVCFFQILMYGKNPWNFFNKRENVVDVICDPNVILQLLNQTPKSLADIINPCFEFEPDDRPTAKEVLEKLKIYMSYLTINNEGIAQWMDESDPNELLFWSSPLKPVDPGYNTQVVDGFPIDRQSSTPTTSIEMESVVGETYV